MEKLISSTGLYGYDLTEVAADIKPSLAYLVNHLPRRHGIGVDVAHWKALTSRLSEPFDLEPSWMNKHYPHTCSLGYNFTNLCASYSTVYEEYQGDDFCQAITNLKIREEAYVTRLLEKQITHMPENLFYPMYPHVTFADIDLLLAKMYINGFVPDVILVPCEARIYLNQCFTNPLPKYHEHLKTGKRIPLVLHAFCKHILALSFKMPDNSCETCWGEEAIYIEECTSQSYMAIAHEDTKMVFIDEVLKVRFLGGQYRLSIDR